MDIYRSGSAQVIGSAGSIVEVRSIKSSIQIKGGPDQGAIAAIGFTNTIQWLHQQKIKRQNYSSYCQNTASSMPRDFCPPKPTQARQSQLITSAPTPPLKGYCLSNIDQSSISKPRRSPAGNPSFIQP